MIQKSNKFLNKSSTKRKFILNSYLQIFLFINISLDIEKSSFDENKYKYLIKRDESFYMKSIYRCFINLSLVFSAFKVILRCFHTFHFIAINFDVQM